MPYADLGADAYTDSLRADATAIAAILRSQGGRSLVSHCPGWDVTDVVAHLGEVHRWAAEIVRTGQPAAENAEWPATDADLADWLEEGAVALGGVLDATDPLTPCWTFGFPPAVAGLWRRRQALETAIHRFDVEHAVGQAVAPEVDLAVAGVTEVVDFMYPRQIALGRTPAPVGQLVLHATDTGDEWVVGPGFGGSATVRDRMEDARISGPAVSLLMMLWGRPHADLQRRGDEQVMAALDAAAVVP